MSAWAAGCGGAGEPLQGAYQLGDNGSVTFTPVKQFLGEHNPGEDELAKLAAFLQEASKNPQVQPEEVKQAIQNVPALRSYVDLIPQTRAELYTFLGTLIALVAMLIAGARELRERREKNKRKATRRKVRSAAKKARPRRTRTAKA